MRVVGLTGHFICLIWQAGAVPGVLRERLEQVKLSVDPGCRGGLGGRLRRTSVGLAHRFPNFLSFPPVFCIPGLGIPLAVSFSTTEKSSSI